jgi:hypothetical protein
MVTACAIVYTIVAACMDLLGMAMSIAWAEAAADNFTTQGLSTHAAALVWLQFVGCCCWQHGIASLAVSVVVGSLQQDA